MHASDTSEDTKPQAQSGRLGVLLAILVVGIAFLLYRNQQGAGGGGGNLPITYGALEQRVAAQPYAGDEALAAIYSDHVGRTVSPETVQDIGSYITNTMVRMYWLEVASDLSDARPISSQELLAILENHCPREVQENSDVVCYASDEEERIIVPAAVLAQVRETGGAWQWIKEFIDSMEAAETVHFRELDAGAVDDLGEFVSVFSVALFDAASRDETDSDTVSNEHALGAFEHLLNWGPDKEAEEESAEAEAEDAAEPAANDDAQSLTAPATSSV